VVSGFAWTPGGPKSEPKPSPLGRRCPARAGGGHWLHPASSQREIPPASTPDVRHLTSIERLPLRLQSHGDGHARTSALAPPSCLQIRCVAWGIDRRHCPAFVSIGFYRPARPDATDCLWIRYHDVRQRYGPHSGNDFRAHGRFRAFPSTHAGVLFFSTLAGRLRLPVARAKTHKFSRQRETQTSLP